MTQGWEPNAPEADAAVGRVRRGEILEGIEEGERDIAEGRTLSWEEQKAELGKWHR